MNVALRDVIEADLPVFFEHQRDEEAVRMAAFASRDRDAFMAHWTTNILGNPEAMAKAIVVDGRLAGNVVAFERDGAHLVGYWVGREFWGRGVATRALDAFLDTVKARPLHAYVAKHNVGSIRVLEKCGFQVEGELHDDVEEWIMRLDRNERGR